MTTSTGSTVVEQGTSLIKLDRHKTLKRGINNNYLLHANRIPSTVDVQLVGVVRKS